MGEQSKSDDAHETRHDTPGCPAGPRGLEGPPGDPDSRGLAPTGGAERPVSRQTYGDPTQVPRAGDFSLKRVCNPDRVHGLRDDPRPEATLPDHPVPALSVEDRLREDAAHRAALGLPPASYLTEGPTAGTLADLLRGFSKPLRPGIDLPPKSPREYYMEGLRDRPNEGRITFKENEERMRLAERQRVPKALPKAERGARLVVAAGWWILLTAAGRLAHFSWLESACLATYAVGACGVVLLLRSDR
jgi:hypothetical protein